MEHIIWSVNPNLFTLGSIQLRWYGLLFVGSFFLGLRIMQWVFTREGKDPLILDNLMLYIMAGAVIGARLMHCLAYEPSFYLSHPLEILMVWKGGLASHGGLAGVIIALFFFARRYDLSYPWLLSRIALPGTLTAAFVRFGNLFNSEILGTPSELPWAIIFSRIDSVPRHPVQLYEAFAYLAILVVLTLVYRRVTPAFATKILPGLFLVMVFVARFFIEYAKTKQAAYTLDIPLSTGQILSIPYIIAGILWILWAIKTSKASHQ